jgi:hypothetical protein
LAREMFRHREPPDCRRLIPDPAVSAVQAV